MFLQGFKRKTAKKLIHKLALTTNAVKSQQIKTVAVLANAERSYPLPILHELQDLFGIPEAAISVVYYSSKKEHTAVESGLVFTDKELGFSGQIKNEAVAMFLSKDYDAVIHFYDQDELLLNLVSAKVKANFRIGFVGTNELLSDFLIKAPIDNKIVFIQELRKYLPILNQM